jgi:kynureninase
MTLPFSTQDYIKQLEDLARQHSLGDSARKDLALILDEQDALASLRKQYYLPSRRDVCAAGKKKAGGDHLAGSADKVSEDAGEPSLYMCGNSLGPLSRLSKQYVQEELEAWGSKAVLGHWDHPFGRPWTRCEERASHLMSDIVGAKRDEVVAMGTLTSNLHVMLASFYRPQASSLIIDEKATVSTSKDGKTKHKIIYEALAFPSDQYALASAVSLAGYDPQTSLVPLRGTGDERTLRTDDVIQVIEREAATGELGLVLLGDVQYQTGQMFDVQTITRRARDLGVIIGWDLAHAFANVPLALHDWDVDFAVWCTYKYGSSGPGGIAGVFVHERWGNIGFTTCVGRDMKDQSRGRVGAEGFPRPAGWWGHTKQTRFSMPDSFQAMGGASGWQQSNPSALDLASLTGSLETLLMAPKLLDSTYDFEKLDTHTATVGFGTIMPALRSKSQCLTTYLEHLVTKSGFLPSNANVKLVTPLEGRFRGSMLSICIPDNANSKEEVAAKAQVTESDTAVNGRSNVPPPIASTSLITRVHKRMETIHGVVCDIRHPDVLRIAPVAQFNTYYDVWQTANALRLSIEDEM